MTRIYSFLLLVILCSFFTIRGQSSCNCEGYGCEVSQNCPEGYIAVCSCTAQGCTGKCKKAEPENEFQEVSFKTGRMSLMATLLNGNEERISQEFSKLLGEKVIFKKAREAQISVIAQGNEFKSYWSVAEFLASVGTISVGGLPFDSLRSQREILLEGGLFKICAPKLSAKRILDEISFLTGKEFKVVAGDPRSNSSVPVQGNNLKEVLDSISNSRNIRISSVVLTGGVEK
ncbi:MAG: hypothetical protein ACRD6X_10620 [Pyrinomonadaceae bacterium]